MLRIVWAGGPGCGGVRGLSEIFMCCCDQQLVGSFSLADVQIIEFFEGSMPTLCHSDLKVMREMDSRRRGVAAGKLALSSAQSGAARLCGVNSVIVWQVGFGGELSCCIVFPRRAKLVEAADLQSSTIMVLYTIGSGRCLGCNVADKLARVPASCTKCADSNSNSVSRSLAAGKRMHRSRHIAGPASGLQAASHMLLKAWRA